MKIQKKKRNKLLPVTLVVAVVVIVISYLLFAFATKSSWPFEANHTDQSTTDDIPKIQSDDTAGPDDTSTEQDSSSNTSSDATKTEGKTPIQYEDEQMDDTPVYNNEQFRIPDENSSQ